MRAEERVRREAIECEVVFKFESGIEFEPGARENPLEILDSEMA